MWIRIIGETWYTLPALMHLISWITQVISPNVSDPLVQGGEIRRENSYPILGSIDARCNTPVRAALSVSESESDPIAILIDSPVIDRIKCNKNGFFDSFRPLFKCIDDIHTPFFPKFHLNECRDRFMITLTVVGITTIIWLSQSMDWLIFDSKQNPIGKGWFPFPISTEERERDSLDQLVAMGFRTTYLVS